MNENGQSGSISVSIKHTVEIITSTCNGQRLFMGKDSVVQLIAQSARCWDGELGKLTKYVRTCKEWHVLYIVS